ncbi:hypothetical protein NHB34_08715 [Polynucleobacter sp. MWH-UH19D]|uniref:hypothetical protein n=1 Tax=Polynucleobacter sp. MWH-UH19D TaxID=1855610 RepID=UPI00336507E8
MLTSESKKIKKTLDDLLNDKSVITGKDLINRHKEAEKQKAILDGAIEFERRNRKRK